MQRKIRWEWWHDPLSDEGTEYVEERHEACPYDDDDFLTGGDELDHGIDQRPARVVIATPAGIIPLGVYKDFNRNFRFFVGHTNFTITKEIEDKIEETEGVEVLNTVSRYRFRVAVGFAFDTKDVRRLIEKVLGAVSPRHNEENPYGAGLSEQAVKKVDSLEKHAREHYKRWAIYVLPNQEIDFFHTDSESEYLHNLNTYRGIQANNGGVIFRSHDIGRKVQ